MADQRSSSTRRSTVLRLLSGVVALGAYLVGLYGAPMSLSRTAAALFGAWLGTTLPVTSWSVGVLLLGPRLGLEPRGVSLGLGPAHRTAFRSSRVLVLRRVPVPLLKVQATVGPRGLRKAPLIGLALLALLVQLLAGGALLLVAGPFGLAAGTGCLGIALVRLGLLGGDTGRSVAGPGMPGTSEADEQVLRVLAAVQRSAAEARTLIESWSGPELRGSTKGRIAELPLLLAEGRYREAVALAETIAAAPDTTADDRVAVRVSQARALAYVMEATEPEPDDREAFLSLYRELRDAPGRLTSGSDLRSLYYLIAGDVELAVDEARTAARVGSAPLRRSMTYCTLAMALHRAGNAGRAEKALQQAVRHGSDYARPVFVAGVLADRSGSKGQPADVA